MKEACGLTVTKSSVIVIATTLLNPLSVTYIEIIELTVLLIPQDCISKLLPDCCIIETSLVVS